MRNSASLCTIAILSLLVGAAPAAVRAADMATKAPPVVAVPAPVADWTGFYGDVGVGWQRQRFDWTYTNFAPAEPPFSLSGDGAGITGHFGYQQQFGWFVLGAEIGALASMTGHGASVTSNGVAVTGPCANLAGLVCSASIQSAALVGGKLGVDWGNWLVYGVGGDVFTSEIATQLSGIASDVGRPNGTHGWYAGGGIDYLLYKGSLIDVIGGVEYEHLELSAVSECSVANVGVDGGCPGTAAAAARVVSGSEDAVWAKLTLKWNPLGH